ncbi:MAG TPA: hypothetical protein PKC43_06220 [Phycisphaerales bacterium]|nr:hypothetical protein [Phycisphaerales bacterium]HMP37027.1 hypothetical protein [Phycisphaerales bacterium]
MTLDQIYSEKLREQLTQWDISEVELVGTTGDGSTILYALADGRFAADSVGDDSAEDPAPRIYGGAEELPDYLASLLSLDDDEEDQ